jgi:hypothetical protein
MTGAQACHLKSADKFFFLFVAADQVVAKAGFDDA